MARANVRIAVIQIELPELHHRVMEQLRVVLRIEEGRRLVRLEAVLLGEIGRRMCRRHIRVCLAGSPPVASKVGHVTPLGPLVVCGAGVE